MPQHNVSCSNLPVNPPITKVENGEMFYDEQYGYFYMVCICDWPNDTGARYNIINLNSGCRRYDHNTSSKELAAKMDRDQMIKISPGSKVTIQAGD